MVGGSEKDVGEDVGLKRSLRKNCMTLVQAVAVCCWRSGVQCTSSGGAWGLSWHCCPVVICAQHRMVKLWLLTVFRRDPLVSQASVAGAMQVNTPMNGMGSCWCLVLRPRPRLSSCPQPGWRCGASVAGHLSSLCSTWSTCHIGEPALLVFVARLFTGGATVALQRGPQKRPAPCVRPGACKVLCMLTNQAPVHVSAVMAWKWRCTYLQLCSSVPLQQQALPLLKPFHQRPCYGLP